MEDEKKSIKENSKCLGCGTDLSQDIIELRTNPTATEWIKNGYCSNKCFQMSKKDNFTESHVNSPDSKVEQKTNFLDFSDSDFELNILEEKKTCFVYFSYQDDYDTEIEKTIEPTYSAYSSEILFAKYYITTNKTKYSDFGVLKTPTILLFRNGEVMLRIIGKDSKNTIISYEPTVKNIMELPTEQIKGLQLSDLKETYKEIEKPEPVADQFANMRGPAFWTVSIIAAIIFAMLRHCN
jgi:Thioredoxin